MKFDTLLWAIITGQVILLLGNMFNAPLGLVLGICFIVGISFGGQNDD